MREFWDEFKKNSIKITEVPEEQKGNFNEETIVK